MAGVQVASRRVARGGSSRTVFRDGLLVRPGDTGHTDTRLNSVPALAHPTGQVTVVTRLPVLIGQSLPVAGNRVDRYPADFGGVQHHR